MWFGLRLVNRFVTCVSVCVLRFNFFNVCFYMVICGWACALWLDLRFLFRFVIWISCETQIDP